MAKKEKPVQDVNLLGKLFPTFANFLSPKVGKRGGAKTFTGKAKPVKPHLPMINLLPPRLELEKMRRSTRRGFLFTGLGILVTVGLLWVAQSTVIGVAQSSLDSAKEQVATAKSNLDKYSEIKAYFQTIQERKDILGQKVGAKIDYEFVFTTLTNSVPNGGTLSQIDVKTLSVVEGAENDPSVLIASCGPVTDPFAVESQAQPLACMTFTGTVPTREDVTSIASSLKASKLFSNVSVVQAAAGSASSGVTFTGTAIITSNALIGVASSTVQPESNVESSQETNTTQATPTPSTAPTATPKPSSSSVPVPTSSPRPTMEEGL